MSTSLTDAVVLVPGTAGSELLDRDGNVWPGDSFDWIFGYSRLERLVSPGLEVGDVVRRLGLYDIYTNLIATLRRCGFSEAGAPPSLYLCPYDWRLSPAQCSERVADVVDRVRAEHGAGVRIALISHSLGGLLCRHYLETARFRDRPARHNVTQLILAGVPHLGLPLMLSLARGDQRYMFLTAEQIRRLLNDDRFPFAYTMLPFPSARAFRQTAGALPWQAIDVQSAPHAQSLGLSSLANLGAAARFRGDIESGRRPSGVRYFSFVGTRRRTYSGAVVSNESPPGLIREDLASGGDGTVPVWSAWLAGEQGIAVGGRHLALLGHHRVRQILALLLGCEPVIAESLGVATHRLEADDLVYDPGAPMELSLTLPAAEPVLSGRLRLLGADPTRDGEIGEPGEIATRTVGYQGVPVRTLTLRTTAPAAAGAYVYELIAGTEDGGDGDALAQAEFYVQVPQSH